jgi:hypothetical protein
MRSSSASKFVGGESTTVTEIEGYPDVTDPIAAGAKDQNSAPVILSTLLEILDKQKEYVNMLKRPQLALKVSTRYPVLLAIEDFQALYCRTSFEDLLPPSSYLCPDYYWSTPVVKSPTYVLLALFTFFPL